MNLEELLGAELAAQVTEALKGKGKDGKDVSLGVINDGSYIPKAKFDELITEKKNLETEIATANTTITDLKGKNKDNEDLQAAITAHETAITEMKAKHEEALKNVKCDAAIRAALHGARHGDLLGRIFSPALLPFGQGWWLAQRWCTTRWSIKNQTETAVYTDLVWFLRFQSAKCGQSHLGRRLALRNGFFCAIMAQQST